MMEQHNQSPTLAALSAALANVQAEVKAAPMDSTNPFLHNRYASLGAVIEAARPVLMKNDLAVCQMPVSAPDGQIGVETMLMHKSGEFISRTFLLPLSEEKGKSLAQVAGSVITYLRRYALAGFLGIYADEDVDGQTPKATAPATRPAAQPKPAGPKPAAPAPSEPAPPVMDAEGRFVIPDNLTEPAAVYNFVAKRIKASKTVDELTAIGVALNAAKDNKRVGQSQFNILKNDISTHRNKLTGKLKGA